jgi:hypothetical protein
VVVPPRIRTCFIPRCYTPATTAVSLIIDDEPVGYLLCPAHVTDLHARIANGEIDSLIVSERPIIRPPPEPRAGNGT